MRPTVSIGDPNFPGLAASAQSTHLSPSFMQAAASAAAPPQNTASHTLRMRRCTCCHIRLPFSEFHSLNHSGRLTKQCKTCHDQLRALSTTGTRATRRSPAISEHGSAVSSLASTTDGVDETAAFPTTYWSAVSSSNPGPSLSQPQHNTLHVGGSSASPSVLSPMPGLPTAMAPPPTPPQDPLISRLVLNSRLHEVTAEITSAVDSSMQAIQCQIAELALTMVSAVVCLIPGIPWKADAQWISASFGE